VALRISPSSAQAARKPLSRKSKPDAATQRGIRPSILYLCFAALFGTNVVSLVGLAMTPEIVGLVDGQKDRVIAAYEDRLAQLRVEVDRLHSRQYAQTGDINLQLQELTQQQEVLFEQHQLVQQLATRAAELGLGSGTVAEVPAVAPVPAALTTHTSDISEMSATMDAMMDDTRLVLGGLSQDAERATNDIVEALGDLGIAPAIPSSLGASGGPYLPPVGDDDSTSLVDEASAAYLSLARFKAARSALAIVPIHRPMDAAVRASSNFGNRTDPFTGGRAFHSGIDFPAPRGTPVLSAGAGTVTFVGEKSGYGKLVEITHANGLITRYGHLSAYIAEPGQAVAAGTPVAEVGSTGRSTGPHLHFEVRRKDRAIDPTRYLAAGERLSRFIGG